MPHRAAKRKIPWKGRVGPKLGSEPAAVVEAAIVGEVKVEEDSVTIVGEATEEMKVEETKSNEEKPSEPESKLDGCADGEEAFEEDKGERLELEYESEYEHDEDPTVDYGEKEMEDDCQEDVEGMVDEEGTGMGAEGKDDDENVNDEYENDVEGEEHHEVVKERRKRKEFEVFVGGLDKNATEEDLRKVFGEVGEITEVRLMMIPQTKKNKGFAFLRFATVEQAKRAVSELKNPVVNGKQCGVVPSRDSDTLFLGNICKTWTKEHLKAKLKNYGIENVEDLTLVEDRSSEGMNRGFAFLEFSSRSEAMGAYRNLQRRDVLLGVDINPKVTFAVSFTEPDDEIMSQVKTIFIDGLPAAWDEDRVKECIKNFGEIEKTELARNMPAAKRKDFGFVTFTTHDAAVTCAERINNAGLGEDIKVKVRARLSRPLRRGSKGKPGVQGDFWVGCGSPRGGRLSWSCPPPHRFTDRGSRFVGRAPVFSGRRSKRPIEYKVKRPLISESKRFGPQRPRLLAPPVRSYERRLPVAAYPMSVSKREYIHDEYTPRKATANYSSVVFAERRSSYREDYSSRRTSYSDVLPRSATCGVDRRPYVDDSYGQKLERSPPTYREGRNWDYGSVAGSKRTYSASDDVPPRYADVSARQSRPRLDYGVSGSSSQYEDAYGQKLERSPPTYREGCNRDYGSVAGSKRTYSASDDFPPRYADVSAHQSRTRLDYGVSGSSSQYEDAYGERIGRSHAGYGGSGDSRSSLSGQDSHELYNGRQRMTYGGGSVSGSVVTGMYSSGLNSSYLSRESDVGGSSYSSLHSSRNLGGSGSGSYY